jgi:hypothetical protein
MGIEGRPYIKSTYGLGQRLGRNPTLDSDICDSRVTRQLDIWASPEMFALVVALLHVILRKREDSDVDIGT